MKNIRFIPQLLLLSAMSAAPETAMAQQATPTLGACYNVQSGKLDVATTAAKCSRNEVFVNIPLVVAEGPRGIVGPAGLQGAQGQKGAIGAAGVTGPKGPTGVDGPAGEVGPEGEIGPAGIKGLQGIEGSRGDVGPDGPAGQPGDPGPQGPIGPHGPTGPDGPQGYSPSIGLMTTIAMIELAPASARDHVVWCEGGRMPLTAGLSRNLRASEIAGFRFEGAGVRFFMRNPTLENAAFRASLLCAWVR